MAEPPPESSHTPPGTPLSGPTRHQGDSMEDYDPPANRKRPRLDSGSGVESLSIASAAPASDMDLDPDSRPAGKMTINVKSPTADMPLESVDSAPALPASPLPLPVHPDATPDNDNVISISSSPTSSSPSQSPQIEVATPEDMDADSHPSNWKPLEEAMRDRDQHQAAPQIVEVHNISSLVDRFPKTHGRDSTQNSLNQLNVMIDRCKKTRTTPLAWY